MVVRITCANNVTVPVLRVHLPICPGCVRGCYACKVDCCEACLELFRKGNGNPLCRDCRTSCGRCGKMVGTHEIDEEKQVCLECFEEDEEEHQSDQLLRRYTTT